MSPKVLNTFSAWLESERATFLPFDLDADPKHSTLAFRKHEADFQVEEVLAFEPSGEGHHLFLRIEKKGLSTAHLIQRLSERWGIPRKAIGFAGRKDQRGLTRQWLSVPDTYFEGKTPDDLEIDGVRTLEVRRNNKKLKLGQLQNNRFKVVLRGELKNPELFETRWNSITADGMPNFFGHQRFGFRLANLGRIVPFLQRRQRARNTKDKFMVSVFQSICFNYWLFQRLRERRLPGLMTGDVILGLPFGQRPFTSDDAEQVMERVKRGELTVAGPLIGPKMMQASSEALAFEQECWTSMGLTKSFCEAHPALDKGARRPAYVPVLSPSWVHNSEGLHLQFSLPKGSFATVFLHHVLPGQIDDFALETQ